MKQALADLDGHTENGGQRYRHLTAPIDFELKKEANRLNGPSERLDRRKHGKQQP